MLTKKAKLNRVIESVDQLVSVTIELLKTNSISPVKQMLNTVKINELRMLQKMVHKCKKPTRINEERVWKVISILIDVVLHVVETALSNSINYQQRHGKLDFQINFMA